MTVTLTLTAAQALTVQRRTTVEDQNHYAHILEGRLKTLTNHLLTSRRHRNEADISSKLLSLFDAPDSAKTKKRRQCPEVCVQQALGLHSFHTPVYVKNFSWDSYQVFIFSPSTLKCKIIKI